MTGVGEIFLSSILQGLLQWFLPYLLDELKKFDCHLAGEVEKLSRSLSSIKSFLERVEVSATTKPWLHLAEDAVYKANDLLDGIEGEMLRQCNIELFPDLREKLSDFSIPRATFKRKASKELSDINTEFDGIIKESNLMRRSNSGGGSARRRENLQTICFEDGPLFGRGDEVNYILGWISDASSSANNNILSIQGMPGVGKTRLAQKIFNDESLANQFGMRPIWVQAPQDTDVRELFKSIIESVPHNGVVLSDLNNMHLKLRELLGQEKYLLVLDGMSTENDHYWQNVKILLRVGAANGSKVIITTCKRNIPHPDDAVPCLLEGLSEDDSLMLFNTCALGDPHPKADQKLNEDRRRILEKCKGLPSALVEFGRRLSMPHHDSIHDQWKLMASKEAGEVIGLNSEIFHTMSSTVKRCFAYCSTFPPGFQFKKEMLVQLWMAQNFVHQADECDQIFNDMYNWYLLEFLDYDYRKTQQTYVMPDIIRSTAQFMAEDLCCMVDIQVNNSNICGTTRHVSIVGNPNHPISVADFRSVYVAKGLYSLLLFSLQNRNKVNLQRAVLDDLAMKLPRLRSLDLSNTSIEELPDSIGDFIHLRYLALRNTGIKKLPDSVIRLCHLQTLGLANCYALEALPSDLKKLRKLMYLDLKLDDDSNQGELKRMPPHMSKLEGLRTLSRFVASDKKHCGDLCISNLASVNGIQAEEANLKDKDHLSVLELQWDLRQRTTARDETDVLEHLRPHTNLKELTIRGYAGCSFPDWMTSPSFSFLATLKLIDCKACNHLPPLGHLPALEQLFIKGMDGITTIDCSLCGSTEPNTGFRSLKKMQLESMHNLQAWVGDQETCNFPSLRELTIRNCENLTQITHSLQSLTKLEVIQCSNLHGLRRFPSLSSLDVRESGLWIWTSLGSLPALSSVTLTRLSMRGSPKALQHLATIRKFEMISCGTPKYLPDNWLPQGLTHLSIKHCSNLQSLPRGLHMVRNLQVLEVQDCEKLELLGERMRELRWSLLTGARSWADGLSSIG
ncbi:P-loop containing nucleoside triphosphate hydrolase protein, partial [Dioscorea alata]